jgi:hypothetical protein
MQIESALLEQILGQYQPSDFQRMMFSDPTTRHRPQKFYYEDPNLKAIADKHLPKDFERRYCSWRDWENTPLGFTDRGAWCRPNEKVLQAPPVVDAHSLFILLHEAGHGNLKHCAFKTPFYVAEYEADEYAFGAMKAEGIKPPTKCVLNQQAMLQRYILDHLNHNFLTEADLDPRVRDWIENLGVYPSTRHLYQEAA